MSAYRFIGSNYEQMKSKIHETIKNCINSYRAANKNEQFVVLNRKIWKTLQTCIDHLLDTKLCSRWLNTFTILHLHRENHAIIKGLREFVNTLVKHSVAVPSGVHHRKILGHSFRTFLVQILTILWRHFQCVYPQEEVPIKRAIFKDNYLKFAERFFIHELLQFYFCWFWLEWPKTTEYFIPKLHRILDSICRHWLHN